MRALRQTQDRAKLTTHLNPQLAVFGTSRISSTNPRTSSLASASSSDDNASDRSATRRR